MILHHMYRDQIAAVADDFLPARAETLRAAYAISRASIRFLR